MLKKKDFIEIEFTGKTKEGNVFDSNVKEELEKLHAGHSHPIATEKFVFCLGEGMFLQSVDDFLIGKPDSNFPESYEIELTPEKAFGLRNSKLVYTVPSRVFRENNMNPVPGEVFNFDGKLGKVLTVSGGRIMVDFNNPLAGKDIIYSIKILRKVDDLNEKIKSFIKFLFKKDVDFEVNEKKIIVKAEKKLIDFADLFRKKFKELFDLELEVQKIKQEKKELKTKSR